MVNQYINHQLITFISLRLFLFIPFKIKGIEKVHITRYDYEMKQYRPDIDGLRAIAVLSVIGFHAFSTLIPGGFIGVDIFFVISGFLITSIIFSDLKENNFSFVNFYIRRIQRIFPPLIIVLLTSIISGLYLLLPQEFSSLGKHIASASAFITNFTLMNESGYFDPAAEFKPLLHLWSLSIEEQFYIVWPFIFAWTFRKKIHPIYSIIFLGISSLILDNYQSFKSDSTQFYFTPSRSWELLIGAIIALNPIDKKISKSLKNFFAFLGLLFIGFALFFYNAYMEYPGAPALIPTLGAMFIILSGPESFISRLLSLKPFVFLGLISYSLYLWHWPLLSFGHILNSGPLENWLKISLVCVSLILAILTYYFIENPLRHSTNRRVPIYLLLTISGLGVLGLSIYKSNGFVERKSMSTYLEKDRFMKWTDNLYSKDWCKKNISFEKKLSYCQISSTETDPSIAIIGDSHSDHFFPGMSENLKKIGENVILLGRSGCPAFKGLGVLQARGRHNNECEKANTEIFKYLKDTPSIHSVFMADRGPIYLKPESWKLTLDGKDTESEKAFFTSAKETFTSLSKDRKKVHYVFTVPELNFNIKNCFKSRPFQLSETRDPCAIPTNLHIESTKNFQKKMSLIANEMGVELIDPASLICSGSMCFAKRKNQLFYRDNNHLSLQGSNLVAPLIVPSLSNFSIKPQIFPFYILIGQSNTASIKTEMLNMEQSVLKGPIPHAYIWNALMPQKRWEILNIGLNTGCGFNTQFGPEIMFMRELTKNSHSHFLFKQCQYSSSLINNWSPPHGDLWKLFDANLKMAVTQAKALNAQLSLKGIIWMQGESEADANISKEEYLKKLGFFFNQINQRWLEISAEEKISVSNYRRIIGIINAPGIGGRKEIQEAQRDYCNNKVNHADCIETSSFPLYDGIHYSTDGQIKFGKLISNFFK